jgi:hypothetical protein
VEFVGNLAFQNVFESAATTWRAREVWLAGQAEKKDRVPKARKTRGSRKAPEAGAEGGGGPEGSGTEGTLYLEIGERGLDILLNQASRSEGEVARRLAASAFVLRGPAPPSQPPGREAMDVPGTEDVYGTEGIAGAEGFAGDEAMASGSGESSVAKDRSDVPETESAAEHPAAPRADRVTLAGTDYELFQKLVWDLAIRNGYSGPENTIVLLDGSMGAARTALALFRGATRIMDFRALHGLVAECTEAIFQGDPTLNLLIGEGSDDNAGDWMELVLECLFDGDIGEAIETVEAADYLDGPDETRYFMRFLKSNRRFLNYPAFRKKGLFTGDGALRRPLRDDLWGWLRDSPGGGVDPELSPGHCGAYGQVPEQSVGEGRGRPGQGLLRPKGLADLPAPSRTCAGRGCQVTGNLTVGLPDCHETFSCL